MEKVYYSYNDYVKDYNKLINLLRKEFLPDVIVAIARGGYTIAHTLSERLEVRNLFSVSSKLYDDTTKGNDISISKIPEEIDNFKKILVVDDIADSGETLIKTVEKIRNTLNDKSSDIKTLTLFKNKHSKFIPDFYAQQSTKWIEFFWERDN